MNVTVEYRLLSIEFRGMKPRAMFNGVTMKHRGRDIMLQNVRTPKKVLLQYLEEIGGREISAIRYHIIVRNQRGNRLQAPVPFCHPVPRGTHVVIELPDDAADWRDNLILTRDGGRRFFSDNFRLPDLMNNPQLPNQPAFQFHE